MSISTAGLIHYWKLDEVGGAARADSKGGNALTVQGAPLAGAAAGKVGHGFDCNAGAAWLEGANVDLSNTSFTVSGWIQAYGLDTTGADSCVLFSQGNAGGGTHEWGIRWSIYYDGGSVQFEYGPGSYVNTSMLLMPVALDRTGTVWNFVCVRYDLPTQTGRLRWNTTDSTPKVFAMGPNFASPFWIGQLVYSGTAYRSQARLDECAIYNRSITDAEVTELYTNPGLPAGLAAGFFAH